MRQDNYSGKCSSNKSTDHSQTVGVNGPLLMQDGILHETLEEFVYEKNIPRAVHTKGYGAFGHFKTLRSMSEYTQACFLQSPGQKISTFSRFSLAVSNNETPDTSRNVRGFSTKFYTDEGNFDLLCNHIPVFLVRDAMKFPSAIKSLSKSPINNLKDPSSFWSFVAKNPECMHFITWLYSDLGTIDNLRCIRTYGVNTYVWKNSRGIRRYVKYHWIPLAGEKSIDRKQALLLAGTNPDIAGKDLYNTLAAGKAVEYELRVQLMDICDADKQPFDVLDDTKIWDEKKYPLIPVGRLTLKRNVDNYKDQVEKSAFSPSNLVKGIELSNDKMLQGRSFIYWDAQRRRIGPDFNDIPINKAKTCQIPSSIITSGEGIHISAKQERCGIPNPLNFIQAGEHYRSLNEKQRNHLVDNIALELYIVSFDIQKCILEYIHMSDAQFAKATAERMQWYSKKKI